MGIAKLSDSVIPHLGEVLLGMTNRGIHIGFIEIKLLYSRFRDFLTENN
ncbi:MAG: hypothetical protein JXB42_04985 [Deltaproteobacteria bacterium]|nr:hypothetical protein [Deltaproteobacteria bacterium]